MSRATDIAALVNGELGKDTLILGSDSRLKTEVIPTGVLPFDDLLQGGVPRGRWTELYGNPSTLKSYVGYHTIAMCQEAGGVAALIDTEHAWDADWGEFIGVDIDDVLYKQPSTAEEAVDITEVLIRQGVDLIVWDSVAAMAPQDEVKKRESGESHQPARLAALMSRALRKLTAANTWDIKTAMLYINQTRMNIGRTFGTQETTPGGRAPAFYASHRIRLQKGGRVTEASKMYTGDGKSNIYSTTGQKVKLELYKSKLTKPQRELWLNFDLSTGEVDEGSYILARALQDGLVTESKGWWKLKGGKKKFRPANLIEHIYDDDDVFERITGELFPWLT